MRLRGGLSTASWLCVALTASQAVASSTPALRSSESGSWLSRNLKKHFSGEWTDPWGWTWGSNDHGGDGGGDAGNQGGNQGGDQGGNQGGNNGASCFIGATTTSSCSYMVFANGQQIDAQFTPTGPTYTSITLPNGKVVLVLKSFCVLPGSGPAATIASNINACGQNIVTDGSWKCIDHYPWGNWADADYDDSAWGDAWVYGNGPDGVWGNYIGGGSTSETFCRKTIWVNSDAPPAVASNNAPEDAPATPENPPPAPAPEAPAAPPAEPPADNGGHWSTSVSIVGDCDTAQADLTDLAWNFGLQLGFHQGDPVTAALDSSEPLSGPKPEGCDLPNACTMTYSFSGTQSWITPEILDSVVHADAFPSIFHTHTTGTVVICGLADELHAPAPAPAPEPAPEPAPAPAPAPTPKGWSTSVSVVTDCAVGTMEPSELSHNLAVALGLTGDGAHGITTTIDSSTAVEGGNCAVPHPCEVSMSFHGPQTDVTADSVNALVQGSEGPAILGHPVCSTSITAAQGPNDEPSPAPAPQHTPAPAPADSSDAGGNDSSDAGGNQPDTPADSSDSSSVAGGGSPETPADSSVGGGNPPTDSPADSSDAGGNDSSDAGGNDASPSPAPHTPHPSPAPHTPHPSPAPEPAATSAPTPAEQPVAAGEGGSGWDAEVVVVGDCAIGTSDTAPMASSLAQTLGLSDDDNTIAASMTHSEPVTGAAALLCVTPNPCAMSFTFSGSQDAVTSQMAEAALQANSQMIFGTATGHVVCSATNPEASSVFGGGNEQGPEDSSVGGGNQPDTPADSSDSSSVAGGGSPETPADSSVGGGNPPDSPADSSDVGGGLPLAPNAEEEPNDSSVGGGNPPTDTPADSSDAGGNDSSDAGGNDATPSPTPSPASTLEEAEQILQDTPMNPKAAWTVQVIIVGDRKEARKENTAQLGANFAAMLPNNYTHPQVTGNFTHPGGRANFTFLWTGTQGPRKGHGSVLAKKGNEEDDRCSDSDFMAARITGDEEVGEKVLAETVRSEAFMSIFSSSEWVCRVMDVAVQGGIEEFPAPPKPSPAPATPAPTPAPTRRPETPAVGANQAEDSPQAGGEGAAGGSTDSPVAEGEGGGAGDVVVSPTSVPNGEGDGGGNPTEPPTGAPQPEGEGGGQGSPCAEAIKMECGGSMVHEFTEAGSVAVFQVTVPEGGASLTASTCADDAVGDTVVSIYDACPTEGSTPVAMNDDDESCDVDATLSTAASQFEGGQVVYVTVINRSIYAASSTLSITCGSYAT